MSTHTPGPWRVDIHPSGGAWLVRPAVCYEIDNKANARLIAAAPDLLEAAQLALMIAESWIHDQLDGTRLLDSALLNLAPVRAAIAKATSKDDVR